VLTPPTNSKFDAMIEIHDSFQVTIVDTSGDIEIFSVAGVRLSDASGDVLISDISGDVVVVGDGFRSPQHQER
jgi:N-dimethylarginine dimethylaminohydrolase